MGNNLERIIAGLPMDAQAKFALMRSKRVMKQQIKKILGKDYKTLSDFTLIPQNVCYGHERFIREYAHYDDDIYAVIEHGLFFGDIIKGSYPFPQEAEIGSFLTFGEYRRKLLQDYYPDKQVFPIGPYIEYATTDQAFLQKLNQEKHEADAPTLTLFPAHGIPEFERGFNHEVLAENTMRIAQQHGYSNVFVCLHPHDFVDKRKEPYVKLGAIPISCGYSDDTFLSRQKAIFEVSDLTLSNDLGTHIGYSLALDVPHRIIEPVAGHAVDTTLKDLNIEAMRAQREDFYEVFGYNTTMDLNTTQAQLDMANYYWGLDSARSPSELYRILRQCRDYYFELVRYSARHRMMQ